MAEDIGRAQSGLEAEAIPPGIERSIIRETINEQRASLSTLSS